MSAYSPAQYRFQTTPAVAESRARDRYVACPACASEASEYLFHRAGSRFVRCRRCALVYVSPVGGAVHNYFDVQRFGRLETAADRTLAVADAMRVARSAAAEFERLRGRAPRGVAWVGRWLEELGQQSATALRLARPSDAEFAAFALEGRVTELGVKLDTDTELLVLNEALEACDRPAEALAEWIDALPPEGCIAVAYADSASLPARLLRKHWPPFFELKRAFYSLPALEALADRCGLKLVRQRTVPVERTPRYVARRFGESLPGWDRAAAWLPAVGRLEVPLGLRLATLERKHRSSRTTGELLSIIVPAYEEAQTVREVVQRLLAKPLKIDKEVIIVESNSRDGTREIVRELGRDSRVRIVLQERARGKGNAVREGLRAARGTILLIQDADFEYDIEDYDALLEPILQRRASFVLGSRTLGQQDWKVRRFANGWLSGMLLNAAQVGFATTFNVLFQQRTTDVNTMFKVFRRECLNGVDLVSDGFELDIELVCKLVRAGHAPLEVPVNYVARGFDQGKKIRFFRDAWPSYRALFDFRFDA